VYLLDEKPVLKPEDAVEVEEARWMPLSRLRNNRLNMDLNTIASQKMKRLLDLVEGAGGATTPRNNTAQTPLDTFVSPSPGEPGEPSPLAL
jgi:hypothetical protein